MFFLAQLLVILYAWCSAQQEIPVVKMAKDYVPHGNPYQQPFHFWGWCMTAIVGAILTLFTGCFLTLFTSALWYSLLFDGWLNLGVGQPFNYIGQTAWIDKKLWALFGKKAPKRKQQITLFLLLNINALYFLL